jgi:hypothetical protein
MVLSRRPQRPQIVESPVKMAGFAGILRVPSRLSLIPIYPAPPYFEIGELASPWVNPCGGFAKLAISKAYNLVEKSLLIDSSWLIHDLD